MTEEEAVVESTLRGRCRSACMDVSTNFLRRFDGSKFTSMDAHLPPWKLSWKSVEVHLLPSKFPWK